MLTCKFRITIVLFSFLILASLLIPTYVFADEFQNNLGKIYWQDDLISLNSFATVYVEDMDMNKKEYPNYADKFKIKVWSDSFPDGIEIEVVENGIYTGIFKARVYVSDTSVPSGIRLLVTPGGTIYALYARDVPWALRPEPHGPSALRHRLGRSPLRCDRSGAGSRSRRAPPGARLGGGAGSRRPGPKMKQESLGSSPRLNV